MSHFREAHETELECIQESSSRLVTKEPRSVVSAKAVRIHSWLETIIMTHQPFSFCENKYLRRHLKESGICTKTLKTYMQLITDRVEKRIAKTVSGKLGLVFNRWTCSTTNYVEVFATFETENELGYEKVFLALSPLDNEACLSASENEKLLEFLLSVYNKDFSNVVALIARDWKTYISSVIYQYYLITNVRSDILIFHDTINRNNI